MKPETSLLILFQHYINSGKNELALKIANDLFKDNSGNIGFLLNYLELQVIQGDYPKALSTLKLLALAEYPEISCKLCLQMVKLRLKKLHSIEDALICAQTLAASGHINESEQAIRVALDMEPENLTVKTELAQIYLGAGKFRLAIQVLQELIQSDECSSKAWSTYGSALRLQGGQDELAYKAHQKALSLDPECHQSLLDSLALEVSSAQNNQDYERCITSSNRCLGVYLRKIRTLDPSPISYTKLKHDHQQAQYLMSEGLQDGLRDFIEASHHLMHRLEQVETGIELKISAVEYQVIRQYDQIIFTENQNYECRSCLNRELRWDKISAQYSSNSPSLVVIDDFLSLEALEYLRGFCHRSKVWHRSYQQAYLGAFADNGFMSKIHMKIAQELKTNLGGIFKNDQLEQLWAFKYDSVLGKGINVHADFARINLNFWITPDEYHLNKQNGGLIVYTEPAPRDWNYFDYNINSEKIYEYLGRHNSKSVTVPYKANRAVLFDSTLFHETDEIKFEDSYLGRRVNMTYLFGTQLK